MNKASTIIIALVILAIGGVVYYTSSMKKTEAVPIIGTPAAPIETTAPSQETVAPIKEFVIEGANFTFTPNSIKVNKGDMVKVTFKNIEGTHDFVIDEYAAKTKVINANEEETIQFLADKTGIFEFYCSVGTHRQMGMKGTLEVM